MMPADKQLPAESKIVDIGRLLDDGPWTPLQQSVVVLAALAIIADGFDGQLIGFAIPRLIKEWGISRDDLAPVVAAGLIGMGVGATCSGVFADRFGRRWAILGSVALLGISTCTIGFSYNLGMISFLRFIAGLGLGGALPVSTTIAAEITPVRNRTLAITATIVCFPLGGMLAGVFASYILPTLGWRALFWCGGILPLLLTLVLLQLPESPRYLAHHPSRWPELKELLDRMSRPVPYNATFVDHQEPSASKTASFHALFEQNQARNTLALWWACFACLFAVYSAFNWLPTMLTNEGFNTSVASIGLTAYNLGGVCGALLCAVAVTRYGSRWPLTLFSAGGMLSAFLMSRMKPSSDTTLLVIGVGVHGMFVTTVQCIIYALCAYVYSTNIRATGTAATLAAGRLGAISSAFAGATVISKGGAAGYFTMLGGAMTVVLIALWMISDQILPSKKHRPNPTQI